MKSPVEVFTRGVLACLLLTALSWAQGMFDLPGNSWQGPTARGIMLELQTQRELPHQFQLKYGPEILIQGHYRVTATKGQPHVAFTPDRINQNGQPLQEVSVEGWPFQLGKDSRAILDFNGPGLTLDSFGPDIDFLWRLELKQSPP